MPIMVMWCGLGGFLDDVRGFYFCFKVFIMFVVVDRRGTLSVCVCVYVRACGTILIIIARVSLMLVHIYLRD